MNEHPRAHGFWLALLLGVVLGIAGIALAIGGGKLLSLGGSAYYLVSGIVLVVVGVLLARRRGAALWLYAVLLLGTLLWALWEVGLDWWQLVPRVAIPCLIAIVMLLPWWRKPLHSRGGSLALLTSVVACIAVAIASQFTSPGVIEGSLADNRANAEPNPAQVAGDDWPAYGGTNAGTHYSSLDQITLDNIGELEEAWRIQTGDAPGPDAPPEITNQNTPLKVNDRLYICTSHSRAMALSPETGETLWEFDPEISTQGAENFSMWPHMTCRGLAYFDAANYAADANAEAAPASSPARQPSLLFAERDAFAIDVTLLEGFLAAAENDDENAPSMMLSQT
ncbi:membrane-bound PQQ-dependent dehydrogenase, glucose/quinate/shikimate family, partial [Halomonas sp. 707D7]|nr:membrane-bound PQQ-dependent dehydrogenase, glucose/quinate/shikimate family [Halomonas sp. 707D7]